VRLSGRGLSSHCEGTPRLGGTRPPERLGHYRSKQCGEGPPKARCTPVPPWKLQATPFLIDPPRRTLWAAAWQAGAATQRSMSLLTFGVQTLELAKQECKKASRLIPVRKAWSRYASASAQDIEFQLIAPLSEKHFWRICKKLRARHANAARSWISSRPAW
jgi:hypothetical protein